MTAPRTIKAPSRRSAQRSRAPERRPELRLVTTPGSEEGRRRRLTTVLAAILASAACAGLFAIVALHVLLAQGQAEIDRLEGRAAAEQQDHDRLRLDLADLEAPNRIVAVAKERLGMVVADHVRYLAPPPPPVSRSG